MLAVGTAHPMPFACNGTHYGTNTCAVFLPVDPFHGDMALWANVIPRLQELEVEVLLLGKQLRSAESKFRETEKALRR